MPTLRTRSVKPSRRARAASVVFGLTWGGLPCLASYPRGIRPAARIACLAGAVLAAGCNTETPSVRVGGADNYLFELDPGQLGASRPSETPATIEAQARAVLADADTVLVSHGTVLVRGAPVDVAATCRGAACDLAGTDRDRPFAERVELADVRNTQPGGRTRLALRRHGLSTWRAEGTRPASERAAAHSYREYGAWLVHGGFVISATGPLDGSVTTDRTTDRWLGRVVGRAAGAPPQVRAVWTGLMVATPRRSKFLGPYRGDLLWGDARIVYTPAAAPAAGGPGAVDVAFTRILNLDRGGATHTVTEVRFDAVALSPGGRFTTGSGDRSLEGLFLGPGTPEVAGVFTSHGMTGAFGAKRQELAQ